VSIACSRGGLPPASAGTNLGPSLDVVSQLRAGKRGMEGVPQKLPQEIRQAAVSHCLALLLLGQEMPVLNCLWQVWFRRNTSRLFLSSNKYGGCVGVF